MTANRRRAGAVAVAALLAASAWWFWPGPGRLPLLGSLHGSGSAFRPLGFAPDGSTVVTTEGGQELVFHDLATGRVRHVTVSPDQMYQGAYSPDGRWLALRTFDLTRRVFGFVVLDASTFEERARFDLSRPFMPHFRFSDDGATFQVLAWDNAKGKRTPARPYEILVWDVPSWAPRTPREPAIPQYVNAEVSPDFRVFVGSDDTAAGVTLWGLDTGARLATIADPSTPRSLGVWSTRMSPDGRSLAVGRNDGAIELWDLPAKTLRRTLRGFSSGSRAQWIEWTPDGGTVVALGEDWEGGHLAALRREWNGFWSRKPLNRSPEVVVWDVARGRVRARMKGQGSFLISPDGSTLATLDVRRPDTVRLWQLSPGRR